mgnify:CR=1 FL=1
MQVSPLSHKLWAFGAAAVGSIVPALYLLLFHSVPKEGRNSTGAVRVTAVTLRLLRLALQYALYAEVAVSSSPLTRAA